MSVISTTESINNTVFRKTYSDSGKYIQKVGTQEFYNEAYDELGSGFEYAETETAIEETPVGLGERVSAIENAFEIIGGRV